MNYIDVTDLENLGYDVLPSAEQLTSICEMASGIADNFCLQPLGKTTTDETVKVRPSSSWHNKLFTSFLPVIQVNSIKVWQGKNNFTDVPVEDCTIDTRLGCILIPSIYCGDIKINYDHGYVAIPADAKRAVISIGANLISDFKRRKQFNLEGVSEITDDKQKVKFFNTADEEDIPTSASSILMRYRKIR